MSASTTMDLQAQSTPLQTPPALLTHVSRSPPAQPTTNPIDDFFGYTLSSSRTHESRHDQSIADVPPPYADDLPSYTKKAEPATLAGYLFKFGFLFPPFWILGAIILMSPLRAPAPNNSTPAWLPDKSESERQHIITQMRVVEVKWAYRCLWALIVLAIFATAIGLAVWAVKNI